jgi:hypothetical protein
MDHGAGIFTLAGRAISRDQIIAKNINGLFIVKTGNESRLIHGSEIIRALR